MTDATEMTIINGVSFDLKSYDHKKIITTVITMFQAYDIPDFEKYLSDIDNAIKDKYDTLYRIRDIYRTKNELNEDWDYNDINTLCDCKDEEEKIIRYEEFINKFKHIYNVNRGLKIDIKIMNSELDNTDNELLSTINIDNPVDKLEIESENYCNTLKSYIDIAIIKLNTMKKRLEIFKKYFIDNKKSIYSKMEIYHEEELQDIGYNCAWDIIWETLGKRNDVIKNNRKENEEHVQKKAKHN